MENARISGWNTLMSRTYRTGTNGPKAKYLVEKNNKYQVVWENNGVGNESEVFRNKASAIDFYRKLKKIPRFGFIYMAKLQSQG